MLAKKIRNAATLAATGNENSMTAALLEPLNEFVPVGIKLVFDKTRSDHGDRPDISIESKGASVGFIEVKRPETLLDAFKVTDGGKSQIDKYRHNDLPVLLTDGLRWYDVSDENVWNLRTAPKLLGYPFVDFSIDYEDEVTEEKLRVLFSVSARVRPVYSQSSAPLGMAMVVDRINDNHSETLEAAWSAARQFLGMTPNVPELGDGHVGEIVAFTLLTIASNLPVPQTANFVSTTRKEWSENRSWITSELPLALSGCLKDFREADGESMGRLLGESGWTVIRSIAAGLLSNGQLSWDRLSTLWDSYLELTGKRRTLGSWQTPSNVAKFQVQIASRALEEMGYSGFSDSKVTALDPCCGTGVYLQAVVEQVEREGGTAASLSRTRDLHARLIGCDISPAAVAASHIRLSSVGILPNLYMTDTLAASPRRGTGRGDYSKPTLFDWGPETSLSSLVSAVKSDESEMRHWADRSNDRDPVIAIIGNPPYLRGGLDESKYLDSAWYDELFLKWKLGSGGGGSLQDFFVAFLAWSFRITSLEHPKFLDGKPKGVITFITNRTWIDGKTFNPLRGWLRRHAKSVDIYDFGPGSRGNTGAQWSQQPFSIETGTAIFCAAFGDHAAEAEVRYKRVAWVDFEVSEMDDFLVVTGNTNWTGKSDSKQLFEPNVKTSGVKTGADKTWVRTIGDRDFGVRHAYRVFDNRYIPNQVPVDGKTAGAGWREDKLYNPHRERMKLNGWYLIGPAKAAKPGPALHASKYIPGNDCYKGSEGGLIIPVSSSTPIPMDYQEQAQQLGLSGMDFWHVILACGTHEKYWEPGSLLSQQLSSYTLEIPLPDDQGVTKELVQLGKELVEAWSLDSFNPVEFKGEPGSWHFANHESVEQVEIHGRQVLREWRKARPGDWPRNIALEYARTISALLRVLEISRRVGSLI